MIDLDEINKRECEFFDRKVIHHADKAGMLHDILCLANADAPCDRYLIYGLDDDGQKIGVQNDKKRRISNQFMDWLAKIPFNKMLSIDFFTIVENDLEFDVLKIKNTRLKPYLICKDYLDKKYVGKGKTVKAGIVYTRIGDTNTPIDSFCDDSSMKKMFREQFYIEAPSIARINNYLKDVSFWKSSYDQNDKLFFYYEYFPEFTVSLSCKHLDEFNEPWVKHFPDKKASSYIVYTRCHDTVLHKTFAVWCDGARFLTIIPNSWSNSKDLGDKENNVYLSYYFIFDSLELLINKMIKKAYKYMSSEFYLPAFPVFKSHEKAEKFLKEDCAGGKEKFVYYFFDSKPK